MTTHPTPLPPTVAELRWMIQLKCAPEVMHLVDELASRAADPAPVADEAAIADLLKRIDKATERVVNNHACMRIPVDMSDVDVVLGDCANAIRSLTRRAAPRNDDKLRKLREWIIAKNRMIFREKIAAWSFEDHVGPDGVVKEIDRLLAESPAGDAGESGSRKRSFDPHGVAGKLRLIASGLTYNEGKAEGVAKHWIYEVAWRIQAGLDHVPDEKRMRGEINDLRARLQAAEADLAAAKSIYREHWDDCETVAEMMRSACNEAMTRLVQFKQRGGLIDKLEADLAAAQKERDSFHMDYRMKCDERTKAIDVENEKLRADLAAAQEERGVAVTGARDFRAAWEREKRWREEDRAAAKAEGARAVVEELAKLACVFETQSYVPYANPASKIWSRIGELRAAQPQTTTAAPATVRQGDEVLREVVTMPFADLIAEEDAKRYYRMVTLCLKELARRALEGKP